MIDARKTTSHIETRRTITSYHTQVR
jgi:hypothetical protein